MPHAIQWLRSLVFVGQIYLMMGLLAIVFTPWAVIDRRGANAGTRTWCRWVRWSARWMVGLETEVRGPVPEGEVLVAAKHQSFLDIIMLVSVLPQPKFIMKTELNRMPILGWYARRLGCVSVDRGKRGQAIRRMLEEVERGRALPGQLVIYPQGTRVAPDAYLPYKVGTAILYEEFGQPCVPVAANVGLFWPKRGIMRRPGRAVIAFLPQIPAGLARESFMHRLEDAVETGSDRLAREARG